MIDEEVVELAQKNLNMTMAEKIAYYNGLGKEAEKEIEKRKTLMYV